MKTINIRLFLALFAVALACLPALLHAGVAQGSETNTKNGNNALQNNTTGTDNAAYGVQAMFSNTTGTDNTGIGFQALYSNIDGFGNNAVGSTALYSNTSGVRNTADGFGALLSLTNGDANTAIGSGAMSTSGVVNFNTAVGRRALFRIQGDQNIGLGFFAGSNARDGSNNDIYIGNVGPVPIGAESNTVRIGTQIPATATFGTESHPMPAHTDTYIAGIFGSMTGTPGMPVYDDSDGKLGTLPSSERFKEDVQPMKAASEALFSLRPVKFRYKSEVAKDTASQFGLVAEEVAKVNPDLVVRDAKGDIHSVRYEAVNAMLLNEFIKEHRQVQEQQKQIDKLSAQLKEQAALIQKVSARVELNESRTQTVAENQ